MARCVSDAANDANLREYRFQARRILMQRRGTAFRVRGGQCTVRRPALAPARRALQGSQTTIRGLAADDSTFAARRSDCTAVHAIWSERRSQVRGALIGVMENAPAAGVGWEN